MRSLICALRLAGDGNMHSNNPIFIVLIGVIIGAVIALLEDIFKNLKG